MILEKDKLLVLFLEDSKRDIEIVHQLLLDGFQCPVLLDSASNKDEYIHFIKSKQYDVILSDYTLPGFNAEDALLLAISVCPDTPFICVSGTIGEDVAVEILKKGATDYVLKDRLGRLTFAVSRAIAEVEEKTRYVNTLSANEKFYRDILDSISEGVSTHRRDGTVLTINKHFADRFAKACQDCIGKNLADFTPEKRYGDLAKIRLEKLAQAYDTGEPVLFEDSWDGHWYHNRFYPVFKNRLVEAVALFSTDVTDKKRAEEEAKRSIVLEVEADILRKKEQENLELLDGAFEGSWVIDLVSGKVNCSEKWSRQIGLDKIPEEEHLAYAGSLIHPDDGTSINSMLLSVGERSPTFDLEFRVRLEDSGYVWTQNRGKILYDDHGNAVKIYGVSIDISKRKQAEEALRNSEKKANALNMELEKADKNKNEFIGVLSHELRNPLAVISAGLQLLEITNNDYQTSKAKEIIKRQMGQLCKLVDDLLDVTRITQNKIELEREHMIVNDIVKNIVDDIKSEYVKKGVWLATRIQVHAIPLYADPVRITQIIGNILMNALKFTPANGAVWLSLKQVKNEAVIQVKDSGKGISPELLPHLFQPFIQAEHSLDRHTGGIGLGLSIVKGIAELHGGNASAYSAGLGKGSSFTIRLPISKIENMGE